MNADDPRLIDYVLGELDPPSRAGIEQQLQADRSTAQELAEWRSFTERLRMELTQEEAPSLEEEQRSELLARAHPVVAAGGTLAMPAAVYRGSGARAFSWWPLAIAASVTVFAGYLFFFSGHAVKMSLAKSSAPLVPAEDALSRIRITLAPEEAAPLPAAPALMPGLALGSPPAPATPIALPKPETLFLASRSAAPSSEEQMGGEAPLAKSADLDSATIHSDAGHLTPFAEAGQASDPAPASRRRSGAARADLANLSGKSSDGDHALVFSGANSFGGVMATNAGVMHFGSQQPRADISLRRESDSLERTSRADRAGGNTAAGGGSFVAVQGHEISTFGLHVGGASYAETQRSLLAGQRPPRVAVRVEELLNHFSYADPAAAAGESFAVAMEVAGCPWAADHRLLRIGLKARQLTAEKPPLAGNSAPSLERAGEAIAKDFQAQIEFNPTQVNAYRLLGYDNPPPAPSDVEAAERDEGKIQPGFAVTALYELIPATVASRSLAQSDRLRYQRPLSAAAPAATEARYLSAPAGATQAAGRAHQGHPFVPPTPTFFGGNRAETAALAAKAVDPAELLTLQLRWKTPHDGGTHQRAYPLTDSGLAWQKSSTDFHWAAAVAASGLLLRDGPQRLNAGWDVVQALAEGGLGEDRSGARHEFLGLIEKAAAL